MIIIDKVFSPKKTTERARDDARCHLNWHAVDWIDRELYDIKEVVARKLGEFEGRVNSLVREHNTLVGSVERPRIAKMKEEIRTDIRRLSEELEDMYNKGSVE